MYIYFLGESSFKIKTDERTIIIDPSDKKTGLTQASLAADITIISQTMATAPARVQPIDEKPPFLIDSPGEYEIGGAFVYGVQGKNKNFLYLIKIDHLKIAHLGGLSDTLDDKTLEVFEGADIAMVPVGGEGLLSGKQADQIISQIEPRIVIPMNYALPKLTVKRDPIDGFLSEMGVKDLEPEKSLKITKSKLPQEETKIIVLEV